MVIESMRVSGIEFWSEVLKLPREEPRSVTPLGLLPSVILTWFVQPPSQGKYVTLLKRVKN